MTRTLNTTKHGDKHTEFEYLYRISYSTGTVLLTSGSANVTIGSDTYLSIGSVIHDVVQESGDSRGQGVSLNLPAVDPTILEYVLGANFKGQLVEIYVMFRDRETGVPDTPDLIWRGRQLSDYKIKQSVARDDSGGGTASIRTRASSTISAIKIVRSVRCNRDSHQRMLERAGLTALDRFFSRIPSLMGREIYWGSDSPDPSIMGRGGGGGVGDDSLEGQR